MKRKSLPIIAGLLALAATGLALRYATAAERVRSEGSPRAAAPSNAPAAPSVLYFVKNPDPAPLFLVQDLSGGIISMPALKGKVVFLNFWATWCGPCRQEIPELVTLQSKYKDQLLVIGASEDEASPAQIANFAKQVGINYPVIMSSPQLEQEYGGVAALPTSFVIDEQGRVVQKHVGLYPLEFYDLEVRALLGQPVNARIETFKDTGQVFLKNASRASELPGVSLAKLNPAQRKQALKELNSKNCTCGCGLTLAQCRINDTACATSLAIANKIVQGIARGTAPRDTAPAKPSATIQK
ncbi:MAG TPA: TlpA disulfide reductase family protein [Candidatus Acidoferrales bacterium]|nr:TlpA disulfide reductase family protein [Candidatus Acidoferrales bacterium]